MSESPPLLEVKNLTKIFTSGQIFTTQVKALNNISFKLTKGEIVSIVGESGSGKSTVANIILRLIRPTNGQVHLNGQSIFKQKLNDYYKHVQVVFQNPFGSFNGFYRVDRVLDKAFDFVYRNSKKKNQKERKIIREEYSKENSLNEVDKDKIIFEALKKVDINPEEVLGRFPHQLSGGQLQRFLLARALIIKPDLLIADEPTTMIDASSRAGILNQLIALGKSGDLSVLFITHDIGQAQYVSDRVLVMKEGSIVEEGPSKEVFLHPKQAYTKRLLEDVPSLTRKWKWRLA